MKTYSLDLRERVYRAYWQREGTVSQIAQTFGVSEGFIYKLRRQEQALGHVEPMPHRVATRQCSRKSRKLFCASGSEKTGFNTGRAG